MVLGTLWVGSYISVIYLACFAGQDSSFSTYYTVLIIHHCVYQVRSMRLDPAGPQSSNGHDIGASANKALIFKAARRINDVMLVPSTR
jgi:hypothetical protein